MGVDPPIIGLQPVDFFSHCGQNCPENTWERTNQSSGGWCKTAAMTSWRSYIPLPKYKVSGIYKPQICRKLAASLRLIFAARLPQTRFSYANYFSGALFWHTMCAASMQRTVVAHCSGTQSAPQVCSAQLPHTVLAHNVRRKYAAHSCRALFWHTMCAVQVSLQRTVAAHCTGT